MRYLSTFSGIEAASVAWEPLGWTPVGFSEIDPFASSVLAERFPGVTNYGDITKHESWGIEPGSVDLLVGGSPCQAFSVAGLRKGLDDPRGQLTLVYLQLAARLRPRWIVWENVPGVLSADGGRAFGAFLGGLEELGYGWAYRILDARYFGVPQRRRRVFLVARSSGDWESCAKVLLEPEGVRGNPPQGGETREGSPRAAPKGAREGGQWWDGGDVASTITRKGCDQRMPDKDNFLAVLDTVGTLDCSCGGDKLQVQHAVQGHLIPVVGETMATLDSKIGGAGFCNQSVDNGHFIPCAFAQSSFAQYTEGEVGNLRASGGDLGGGSETLVLHQQTIGALCASDWRQMQSQMVDEDKFLVCKSAPVAIQGNLIGRDKGGPQGVGCSDAGAMYTLTRGDVHGVAIPIDGRNAMRDPEKFDEMNRQGVGVGQPGDPSHTVTTACVHAVAIPVQDGRGLEKAQNGFGVGSAGDPSYTIDTTGAQSVALAVDVYNQKIDGDCAATVTSATGIANASGPKVCIGLNSEMNAMNDAIGTIRRGGEGGRQEIVAFAQNQLGEVRCSAICGTLNTNSNATGRNSPLVAFSSNMSDPDARTDDCSPCLKLGGHGGSNPPAIAFKPGQSSSARSDGVSFDCAPTLESGGGGNNKPAIAFTQNQRDEIRELGDCASALGGQGTHQTNYIAETQQVAAVHEPAMVVRRLLPVECERLQGFPDGWTMVSHKGKPAADGPRYKALGNSMAVPCMRWIGERIKALEEGRL